MYIKNLTMDWKTTEGIRFLDKVIKKNLHGGYFLGDSLLSEGSFIILSGARYFRDLLAVTKF